MRSDLKDRRKALKQRLMQLSSRLETLPQGPFGGSDLHDDPKAREASLGAEAEITSIHAALRRMDCGDYGLCAACGAPISKARLDAFPFTSHCGDCPPLAH